MASRSIIQLFLLYLIVVGATLGVLGQRRKAAKKQQPQEAPQTPLRDIAKAPRQPKAHAHPHRKIAVQAVPEKAAERTTDPATDPKPVEESAQQEERVDDIARDFDLRKAVIYSELLKPKFDSENDR